MLAVFLTETSPPWSWWIILPITVWVIYTADHIMDGLKTGPESKIKRHKFHRNFLKSLGILTLITGAMIPLLAILTLPQNIFIAGLILGIISLLHVIFSYYSFHWYIKEIFIAVIYTTGVWFVPFIEARNLSIEAIAGFVLLLSSAVLNLLFFSFMEHDLDIRDGHRSITTQFGKNNICIFIYLLSSLASSTSVWFMLNSFPNNFLTFLPLLLLNFFPLLTCWKPVFFNKNERFRKIGDRLFILNSLPFLWSAIKYYL